MSPRDFDRDVVQSRLAVMQELLSDLSALGAITAADLGDDRMLRHAVERILSQLVELAVSINGHVSATQRARAPGGYRESFELLADVVGLPDPLVQSLRRSVGLRNVLAHEYVRVDLGVVADAIPAAGHDYGEYVRHVARWLSQRSQV